MNCTRVCGERAQSVVSLTQLERRNTHAYVARELLDVSSDAAPLKVCMRCVCVCACVCVCVSKSGVSPLLVTAITFARTPCRASQLLEMHKGRKSQRALEGA